MRILVLDDDVEVVEADQFTALSMELIGVDPPRAAAVLAEKDLGELDTTGHARISVGALRALAEPSGTSANWAANWDAMIDYARKKGWVEGETGHESVRVHLAPST